MKIKDEATYNALAQKPRCKVTNLELTWRQHKAFGLYCSLPIKQLLAKHKDVEVVRKIMKDWMYCPATNSYHADVHRWAISAAKIKVPLEVRAAFYEQAFRPKQICKFPGCKNTVPFEFLRKGTCCNQHYSQGRRIRLGHYRLEDLKFTCALDGMRFYRSEDVAAHLRSVHNYSDEQMEEYYRTHVMKPGNNSGCCKWCGKLTRLHNFTKGYFDFCANTDCNVRWHNANTDRLERCSTSMREVTSKGDVLPTQVGYWLKRGFGQMEAEAIVKKLASDRKYDVPALMRRKGISEAEAIRLVKERTGKWMRSFHHKVPFSPASQEFFWRLWEKIRTRVPADRVFFATFNRGRRELNKNMEWLLEVERTFYKLDFLISGINFVIEFDDPNHRRTISILKDRKRDAEILAAFGHKGVVHHVPTKAFHKSPHQIVEDCARLIHAALEAEKN